MGNISSINFKKSKDFQVYHNSDIRPSYAIGGGLEVNRNHNEALMFKNQIINIAKENYTKFTRQKFQAKSYEWSAVVNIKPNTTMQDLEKLAKHFSDKYGFQCYQIAIHRDEGHIDELGEKHINHHAHLEFITLDKETGKNNWQRRHIGQNTLRQIQSEVAEILQMERGIDKRLSGAKRIEPRKYAQMKEQEKKNTKALKNSIENLKGKNTQLERECVSLEQANTTIAMENDILKQENDFLKGENEQLLTPKEIKELLEAFRKQCIGKGLPKEFFRALSEQKQNPKQNTKQELELFCEDLLRAYEKKNDEIKSTLFNLIDENTSIKAELHKERKERIKAEESLSELRNARNLTIEQMRQMQLRIDGLELELEKEREERKRAEAHAEYYKAEIKANPTQNTQIVHKQEPEPNNILEKLNDDERKDLDYIAEKMQICNWSFEKLQSEMVKIHNWQMANGAEERNLLHTYPQWGVRGVDSNESCLKDKLKQVTYWFSKRFHISEIKNFIGAIFQIKEQQKQNAQKYISNIDNLIDKVKKSQKEHQQQITPREAEIQAPKEKNKESALQIHKKRNNDWNFER